MPFLLLGNAVGGCEELVCIPEMRSKLGLDIISLGLIVFVACVCFWDKKSILLVTNNQIQE